MKTMGQMRIIGRSELAKQANQVRVEPAENMGFIEYTTTTRVKPIVQRVPTGFPSPAEDQAEAALRLDDLLVQHPAATFFIAMGGDALVESGIFAGDVLVIDRALYPTYGAVVVVALDGVLVARHYCPDSEALHLLPAHPDFAPISIRDRARYEVWGVVTGVVRRLYLQTPQQPRP